MSATIEERTYQFSRSVLYFIRKLWRTPDGRILAQQILRSATSIAANVAEGRESSSKRQFLQYLQIALRSSRETEFWLRLLADTLAPNDTALIQLRSESDQITRILVASVRRLKGLQSK